MKQDRAAHLGDWINPPVVQDKVVRFMSAVTEPVLLAEVAEHCGIRTTAANRVLDRLRTKGFITRYKIPIQRRNRQGWCTRRLYIYSLAEGAE